MTRRTNSWQERQLRDEEFRNKMTCPVCGTKVKEFANITALPTSGFIGHGQWYCSASIGQQILTRHFILTPDTLTTQNCTRGSKNFVNKKKG